MADPIKHENKDKAILSDIALALNCHGDAMGCSAHFVDLTIGDVTFVPGELMIDDIDEEDISDYADWEQEIIRTYLEHELIKIKPISSHESFRVMEGFVESRSDAREIRGLKLALSKKKPFAGFRLAVEMLGILQEWYDYKNAAELKQAEEWLEENGLEIREGRVVCTFIVPTEIG